MTTKNRFVTGFLFGLGFALGYGLAEGTALFILSRFPH